MKLLAILFYGAAAFFAGLSKSQPDHLCVMFSFLALVALAFSIESHLKNKK